MLSFGEVKNLITKRKFDVYNGKDVYLYILKNDFLEVGVLDFGGILQSLKVKIPSGFVDVSCSAKNCAEYVSFDAHMGGTVGRVANRIGNATFLLNGERYYLDKNVGDSTLHSGFNPYDYRLFDAEVSSDELKLHLFSPDGDQGFPGNLDFDVAFRLVDNSLEIVFYGHSDKDTPFNPTNHIYFNLNGEGNGNIYDTLVQINSDAITLADDNLVVTGDIMNVASTPFDFTKPKRIAPSIFADNKQLCSAGGFDHNFILNGEHAATCVGDKSGIRLDLYTDYPGVQFYCGNMINDFHGKSLYKKQCAFCLEPQYFPNAVNIPEFLSPVIKAGATVRHYIKYVFSAENKNL